jgi:hypothetical protein
VAVSLPTSGDPIQAPEQFLGPDEQARAKPQALEGFAGVVVFRAGDHQDPMKLRELSCVPEKLDQTEPIFPGVRQGGATLRRLTEGAHSPDEVVDPVSILLAEHQRQEGDPVRCNPFAGERGGSI